MKLLRLFQRGESNMDDNHTTASSGTHKSTTSHKRRGRQKKDRSRSSDTMKAADVTASDTDSASLSIEEELAALSILDDSETFMASDASSTLYVCSFRCDLDAILDGKTNKTVLLGDAQMCALQRSIAADYTEMLLHEDSEEHNHGVQVHLNCASHVMEQFWEVQGKILLTKFATTTQEMLFLSLEDYVLPRLIDQLYPIQELSPEITAMAISWICQLEDDLQRWAPDLELCEDWHTERQNLFDHYLDRAVRHEMTILLMEVLKLHSDDEIRRDAEEKLVTGLPEQVTFIINQQLNVASDRLPAQFKEDILIACNQELSAMIADWTLRISSEWATMSTAYFCAIINDTIRLSEYCEERHDELLTRPENIETAHTATRDISELSLHANRYLCERIIHDLCHPEPILTLVGGTEWEDPEEHSPVERTIATFKDFLADIEEWLDQDYFFPKVIKNCLDLALQTYLESFFANTMSSGLKNPYVAAEELRQDYLRFVEFFNGESFTDYHGRGGFYAQKSINDRWRILQHMADVIDPSNRPENLAFEVQELMASFGAAENGGPVMLHLAGLRKRQRAHDSTVWLKEIAVAKKNIAAIGNAPAPLVCRLPDMRNSKMLRKLRPLPRAGITRELSRGTRPFAESTARLMQPPNPSSVSTQLMELRCAAVDRLEVFSSYPNPLVAGLYGPTASPPSGHVPDSENRENAQEYEEDECMEGRALVEI